MAVAVQIGEALFTTGDGLLLGGSVERVRGTKRRASSAQVQLADPLWELVNILPLPTRQARIPFHVWHRVQARAPLSCLFMGWVSQMTCEEPPGRLTIMAVDRSKAARRKQRARARSSTSVEQLARLVADEEGLRLDVSGANAAQLRSVGSVWQHGEGDWQVLERLALSIGHEVVVEDDVLLVRKLDGVAEQGSILQVARGTDVVGALRVEINERVARDARTVSDYTGTTVVESSEDEAVYRPVQLTRAGLVSEADELPSYTDQAVEWARRGQSRRRKVFEASLTLARLEPALKPGRAMTLRGWGERFDGVWVIDRVRHTFGTPERTEVSIYNGGAD